MGGGQGRPDPSRTRACGQSCTGVHEVIMISVLFPHHYRLGRHPWGRGGGGRVGSAHTLMPILAMWLTCSGSRFFDGSIVAPIRAKLPKRKKPDNTRGQRAKTGGLGRKASAGGGGAGGGGGHCSSRWVREVERHLTHSVVAAAIVQKKPGKSKTTPSRNKSPSTSANLSGISLKTSSTQICQCNHLGCSQPQAHAPCH